MGAPILRTLRAVKDKKANDSLNCEIPYRLKESYWIRVNDPSKMSLIFNVNFEDKIDLVLAQEILAQLVEA